VWGGVALYQRTPFPSSPPTSARMSSQNGDEPASPVAAAATTPSLLPSSPRTPASARGPLGLQASVNASLALSVMLRLKRSLRTTYGLTDERLQHFSPTEAPQKEEARVLKEEPLGLEQVSTPFH
jgi:hypothetical protein